MKVFISWSGDCSKKIAAYLHDWIPSVLQTIRPYMSAENIDKGDRWSQDLANQLQDTNYGIICVTPDNITAPWILFESGALSKSIQTAKVSPVIFGLSPSDLSKSPLLQFQLTQFNNEDMRKLMASINNSAPENERISPELLSRAFERAWPELDEAVGAIDVSSAVSDAAFDTSMLIKGLDIKLVDSVEKILTNTRAQLKLLNSPSELLPPAYFREVSRGFRGIEGQDGTLPADHPVWIDVLHVVSRLKAGPTQNWDNF